MSDDTEELSGWQLRVRELSEEQAAAQQRVPVSGRRKVMEFVGAFAAISVLFVAVTVAGWSWATGDTSRSPAPRPVQESNVSADLNPEVVDAARECVAGGYGSADECVVGAVIAEGGG